MKFKIFKSFMFVFAFIAVAVLGFSACGDPRSGLNIDVESPQIATDADGNMYIRLVKNGTGEESSTAEILAEVINGDNTVIRTIRASSSDDSKVQVDSCVAERESNKYKIKISANNPTSSNQSTYIKVMSEEYGDISKKIYVQVIERATSMNYSSNVTISKVAIAGGSIDKIDNYALFKSQVVQQEGKAEVSGFAFLTETLFVFGPESALTPNLIYKVGDKEYKNGDKIVYTLAEWDTLKDVGYITVDVYDKDRPGNVDFQKTFRISLFDDSNLQNLKMTAKRGVDLDVVNPVYETDEDGEIIEPKVLIGFDLIHNTDTTDNTVNVEIAGDGIDPNDMNYIFSKDDRKTCLDITQNIGEYNHFKIEGISPTEESIRVVFTIKYKDMNNSPEISMELLINVVNYPTAIRVNGADTSYDLYGDYDDFDSINDYIGYYILKGGEYVIVTESNLAELEIILGTTKAYTMHTDTMTVYDSYENVDGAKLKVDLLDYSAGCGEYKLEAKTYDGTGDWVKYCRKVLVYKVEDILTFTKTEDYINYYIYNGEFIKVNSSNYNSLGIVIGESRAYSRYAFDTGSEDSVRTLKFNSGDNLVFVTTENIDKSCVFNIEVSAVKNTELKRTITVTLVPGITSIGLYTIIHEEGGDKWTEISLCDNTLWLETDTTGEYHSRYLGILIAPREADVDKVDNKSLLTVSISDESVATIVVSVVKNGISEEKEWHTACWITAKSCGNAVITITAPNGKKISFNVRVEQSIDDVVIGLDENSKTNTTLVSYTITVAGSTYYTKVLPTLGEEAQLYSDMACKTAVDGKTLTYKTDIKAGYYLVEAGKEDVNVTPKTKILTEKNPTLNKYLSYTSLFKTTSANIDFIGVSYTNTNNSIVNIRESSKGIYFRALITGSVDVTLTFTYGKIEKVKVRDGLFIINQVEATMEITFTIQVYIPITSFEISDAIVDLVFADNDGYYSQQLQQASVGVVLNNNKMATKDAGLTVWKAGGNSSYVSITDGTNVTDIGEQVIIKSTSGGVASSANVVIRATITDLNGVEWSDEMLVRISKENIIDQILLANYDSLEGVYFEATKGLNTLVKSEDAKFEIIGESPKTFMINGTTYTIEDNIIKNGDTFVSEANKVFKLYEESTDYYYIEGNYVYLVEDKLNTVNEGGQNKQIDVSIKYGSIPTNSNLEYILFNAEIAYKYVSIDSENYYITEKSVYHNNAVYTAVGEDGNFTINSNNYNYDDCADCYYFIPTTRVRQYSSDSVCLCYDEINRTYSLTPIGAGNSILYIVAQDSLLNEVSAINSASQIIGSTYVAMNISVADGVVAYLRLKTSNDIKNLSQNVNENAWDKKYYLMNNIDVSDIYSWKTIGNDDTPFTGTITTMNNTVHTIYGLKLVANLTQDNYGFFGSFEGVLNNVALKVDTLTVIGNNSSDNNVGVLAGIVGGEAKITNVSVSVNNVVINKENGTLNIGTIGETDGTPTLENLYVIFNAKSITATNSNLNLGGVIGYNNCVIGEVEDENYNLRAEVNISTANISTSGGNIGGVIGYNIGNVHKLYATGSIVLKANENANVGGLIGYSTGSIHNSDSSVILINGANVGGLVGYAEAIEIIGSCYNIYDNDSASISSSYYKEEKDDEETVYTPEAFVGGFVGQACNGIIITTSYVMSFAQVNVHEIVGNFDVGGFVGGAIGSSGSVEISQSFVSANIYLGTDNAYIGGFIGCSTLPTSIENCYTSGRIIVDGNCVGLEKGIFVGYTDEDITITTSYNKMQGYIANGENLVAQPYNVCGGCGSPNYTTNYALTGTISETTGFTSKSADDMRTEAGYLDFDFSGDSSIWTIDSNKNDGYAILRGVYPIILSYLEFDNTDSDYSDKSCKSCYKTDEGNTIIIVLDGYYNSEHKYNAPSYELSELFKIITTPDLEAGEDIEVYVRSSGTGAIISGTTLKGLKLTLDSENNKAKIGVMTIVVTCKNNSTVYAVIKVVMVNGYSDVKLYRNKDDKDKETKDEGGEDGAGDAGEAKVKTDKSIENGAKVSLQNGYGEDFYLDYTCENKNMATLGGGVSFILQDDCLEIGNNQYKTKQFTIAEFAQILINLYNNNSDSVLVGIGEGENIATTETLTLNYNDKTYLKLRKVDDTWVIDTTWEIGTDNSHLITYTSDYIILKRTQIVEFVNENAIKNITDIADVTSDHLTLLTNALQEFYSNSSVFKKVINEETYIIYKVDGYYYARCFFGGGIKYIEVFMNVENSTVASVIAQVKKESLSVTMVPYYVGTFYDVVGNVVQSTSYKGVAYRWDKALTFDCTIYNGIQYLLIDNGGTYNDPTNVYTNEMLVTNITLASDNEKDETAGLKILIEELIGQDDKGDDKWETIVYTEKADDVVTGFNIKYETGDIDYSSRYLFEVSTPTRNDDVIKQVFSFGLVDGYKIYYTQQHKFRITVSDFGFINGESQQSRKFYIQITPESVTNIEMMHYADAEYDANEGSEVGAYLTNAGAEPTNTIVAGEYGLLKVNIEQYYAQYDSITISSNTVNGDTISFSQVVAEILEKGSNAQTRYYAYDKNSIHLGNTIQVAKVSGRISRTIEYGFDCYKINGVIHRLSGNYLQVYVVDKWENNIELLDDKFVLNGINYTLDRINNVIYYYDGTIWLQTLIAKQSTEINNFVITATVKRSGYDDFFVNYNLPVDNNATLVMKYTTVLDSEELVQQAYIARGTGGKLASDVNKNILTIITSGVFKTISQPKVSDSGDGTKDFISIETTDKDNKWYIVVKPSISYKDGDETKTKDLALNSEFTITITATKYVNGYLRTITRSINFKVVDFILKEGAITIQDLVDGEFNKSYISSGNYKLQVIPDYNYISINNDDNIAKNNLNALIESLNTDIDVKITDTLEQWYIMKGVDVKYISYDDSDKDYWFIETEELNVSITVADKNKVEDAFYMRLVTKDGDKNGWYITPLQEGEGTLYMNGFNYQYNEDGKLEINYECIGKSLCISPIVINYNFSQLTSLDSPIPIYNKVQLANMDENKHYRLMANIIADNWTPLNTKILSLDGNGFTITITSFDEVALNVVGTDTKPLNLGLFGTISENTFLKNIIIIYDLPLSDGKMVINASNSPYTNFGGLAGVNNGVVTNCIVQSKRYDRMGIDDGPGQIGFAQVKVDSPNIASAKNGQINVAGLIGVNNGEISNSKIDTLGLIGNGSVAGFVVQNSGVIASSYVNYCYIKNESSNNNIGVTAGFVVYNNPGSSIITSYIGSAVVEKEVITQKNKDDIVNYAINTDATIEKEGHEYYLYNGRTTSVVSLVNAGGFVYQNSGNISDSYSAVSLSVDQLSALTGGFAYSNGISGTISRCYSVSYSTETNKAHTPFIAPTSDLSALNNENTSGITDCMFYDIGFAAQSVELTTALGIKSMNLADFIGDETRSLQFWSKYSINKPSAKSGEVKVENYSEFTGVWTFVNDDNYYFNNNNFLPEGYVQQANLIAEDENAQSFTYTYTLAGPTLVSANLIAKGTWTTVNYEEDKNDPSKSKYKYSDRIVNYYLECDDEGVKLASPRLVDSARSLYDNFMDDIEDGVISDWYRLVNNIDLSELIGTAGIDLSIINSAEFKGNFEGNGFTIKGIDLASAGVENFGLFAKIASATSNSQTIASVQNLNLEVVDIKASLANNVGVLAGSAENVVLQNIVVKQASGSNVCVTGRNLVGGLVGLITGKSRVSNITSSVSVSAVYGNSVSNSLVYNRDLLALYNNELTEDQVEILLNANAVLCYAGAVFGVADLTAFTKNNYVITEDEYFESKIENIKVIGKNIVVGTTVGGAIGLVGASTYVGNIHKYIESNGYVKGSRYVGGLIGENHGVLNNASLEYVSEIQTAIDSSTDIGAVNGNENATFFTGVSKAIGGLVGLNVGILNTVQTGIIENSYNKVSVLNREATVSAGLIGICIGGEIEYCYVTGSVSSARSGITAGAIGKISDWTKEYVSSPFGGETLAGMVSNTTIVDYVVAKNNWRYSDFVWLQSTSTSGLLCGFIGVISNADYLSTAHEDAPITNNKDEYDEWERNGTVKLKSNETNFYVACAYDRQSNFGVGGSIVLSASNIGNINIAKALTRDQMNNYSYTKTKKFDRIFERWSVDNYGTKIGEDEDDENSYKIINYSKAKTPIYDPIATPKVYYIYTVEDFMNIKGDLAGKYILMNDLDFTGVENYKSLGENRAFKGSLTGTHYDASKDKNITHVIYNLTINGAGVFKNTEGAIIKDLVFVNLQVLSDNNTSVGLLVGDAIDTTITNVQIVADYEREESVISAEEGTFALQYGKESAVTYYKKDANIYKQISNNNQFECNSKNYLVYNDNIYLSQESIAENSFSIGTQTYNKIDGQWKCGDDVIGNPFSVEGKIYYIVDDMLWEQSSIEVTNNVFSIGDYTFAYKQTEDYSVVYKQITGVESDGFELNGKSYTIKENAVYQTWTGSNELTIAGSITNVGGFIGKLSVDKKDVTISNIAVEGDIESDETNQNKVSNGCIGGLFGQIESQEIRIAKIEKSYYQGNIIIDGSKYSSDLYIGSIVGKILGDDKENLSFENIFSESNVKVTEVACGNYHAGGFAGQVQKASISNVTIYGDWTQSICNTTSKIKVGGFIGDISESAVEKCMTSINITLNEVVDNEWGNNENTSTQGVGGFIAFASESEFRNIISLTTVFNNTLFTNTDGFIIDMATIEGEEKSTCSFSNCYLDYDLSLCSRCDCKDFKDFEIDVCHGNNFIGKSVAGGFDGISYCYPKLNLLLNDRMENKYDILTSTDTVHGIYAKGSKLHPIQVSNSGQFTQRGDDNEDAIFISTSTDESGSIYKTYRWYIQTEDISGVDIFTTASNKFIGFYNANSHTIKTKNYDGIFGKELNGISAGVFGIVGENGDMTSTYQSVVASALVSTMLNAKFVKIESEGESETESNINIGIIAQKLNDRGIIFNTAVTGTINIHGSNYTSTKIGGFVACSKGQILACSSDLNINVSNASYIALGGFVGNIYNTTTYAIKDSYFIGNINDVTESGDKIYIAGLVGIVGVYDDKTIEQTPAGLTNMLNVYVAGRIVGNNCVDTIGASGRDNDGEYYKNIYYTGKTNTTSGIGAQFSINNQRLLDLKRETKGTIDDGDKINTIELNTAWYVKSEYNYGLPYLTFNPGLKNTGNGTVNKPYLINNELQLAWALKYGKLEIDSRTHEVKDSYYFKLTADMDYSNLVGDKGITSAEIAQLNFNGVLDGNEHYIINSSSNTYEYKIDETITYNGNISCLMNTLTGTVKNLGFKSINSSATTLVSNTNCWTKEIIFDEGKTKTNFSETGEIYNVYVDSECNIYYDADHLGITTNNGVVKNCATNSQIIDGNGNIYLGGITMTYEDMWASTNFDFVTTWTLVPETASANGELTIGKLKLQSFVGSLNDIDVSTVSGKDIINGTEHTINISTKDQYAAILQYISRSGTAGETYNINIANDIDMEGMEVPSLLTGTSDINVNINGNGHTIYNFMLRGANDNSNIGFVEYLTTNSSISNIKFNQVNVVNTHSDVNVAVVVGNNKGTISNVYVTNCIIRTLSEDGEDDKVGIIAGNSKGTIQNAMVKTITIKSNAKKIGGIAGYNKGDIIGVDVSNINIEANNANTNNVGGVVGYNNCQGYKISNINISAITLTINGGNVGAIVGYNEQGKIEYGYKTFKFNNGDCDYIIQDDNVYNSEDPTTSVCSVSGDSLTIDEDVYTINGNEIKSNPINGCNLTSVSVATNGTEYTIQSFNLGDVLYLIDSNNNVFTKYASAVSTINEGTFILNGVSYDVEENVIKETGKSYNEGESYATIDNNIFVSGDIIYCINDNNIYECSCIVTKTADNKFDINDKHYEIREDINTSTNKVYEIITATIYNNIDFSNVLIYNLKSDGENNCGLFVGSAKDVNLTIDSNITYTLLDISDSDTYKAFTNFGLIGKMNTESAENKITINGDVSLTRLQELTNAGIIGSIETTNSTDNRKINIEITGDTTLDATLDDNTSVGVVGKLKSAKKNIVNITINGNVNITATATNVGGVVGYAEKTEEETEAGQLNIIISSTDYANDGINIAATATNVGGFVGYNKISEVTFKTSDSDEAVHNNITIIANANDGINIAATATNVGGFIGYNEYDQVKTISANYLSVTYSESSTQYTGITITANCDANSVGGIIGYNRKGYVDVNVNNITITSAPATATNIENIGGVVGKNEGQITIVGVSNITINGNANITATNVGGVVGHNLGIINSKSEGSVLENITINDNANITATNVGGIVGLNDKQDDLTGSVGNVNYEIIIKNFKITGNSYTSTLVGHNKGTIQNIKISLTNTTDSITNNAETDVGFGFAVGVNENSIKNISIVSESSSNYAKFIIPNATSNVGVLVGKNISSIENCAIDCNLLITDNSTTDPTGIYIKSSKTITNVGVIGYSSGTITDLSIKSNITIDIGTESSNVGIIGKNEPKEGITESGIIENMNIGNSSSSITLTINNKATNVGFVGNNAGTIKNITLTKYGIIAYQSNNVGFVGNNTGSIIAEGTTTITLNEVTIMGNENVGGIAGNNTGSITGQEGMEIKVLGSTIVGAKNIGGIAGNNTGSISYADICTLASGVTTNIKTNITAVRSFKIGDNQFRIYGSRVLNGEYSNVGNIAESTMTINSFSYIISGLNIQSGGTNIAAIDIIDGYIGGIAGQNNNTISYCDVVGNIGSNNANIVGGIVGQNNAGSTITNCTFDGTVFGQTQIGGIAGNNAGTIIGNSTITFGEGSSAVTYTIAGNQLKQGDIEEPITSKQVFKIGDIYYIIDNNGQILSTSNMPVGEVGGTDITINGTSYTIDTIQIQNKLVFTLNNKIYMIEEAEDKEKAVYHNSILNGSDDAEIIYGMKVSGTIKGVGVVGGVAGINNGTISGTIQMNATVSGVGDIANSGKDESYVIGGVIGENTNTGTLSAFINIGTKEMSGGFMVGGVIALNRGSFANACVEFTGKYNGSNNFNIDAGYATLHTTSNENNRYTYKTNPAQLWFPTQTITDGHYVLRGKLIGCNDSTTNTDMTYAGLISVSISAEGTQIGVDGLVGLQRRNS